MGSHLRGNVGLLVSSLVVCCVLYPLSLYAVGRGLFPTATSGSLIDGDGTGPRGSRLIAQPFTADEYFWPRPSAASYNATASGGSNLGANNPKLRDRAAQQLGPVVVYKTIGRAAAGGRTPQQDLEAWFAAVPDRAAAWAADATVGPANWAKTDLANDKYGAQGEYILQWAKDHPEVAADWRKANPDKGDEPKPEDLVGGFFASFARVHPGKWPGVVEAKQADGTTAKRVEPVASDPALHANLFDAWLSDPANADKAADLEPMTVDAVTTSGSGLDPHVTVRNALSVYQLDRVAKKRAAPKEAVAELVRAKSFTPLSGLVGEPLVNVLELNVELDARYPRPRTP